MMQPSTSKEAVDPETVHSGAQESKSWMTSKKRLEDQSSQRDADGVVQTRLSIADLKGLVRHSDGPDWEMYKTA